MNLNHEGGGNFRLIVIDISQIRASIFKASELVKTLGLDIPDRARECVSNEYLATCDIPVHAIVSCQSVEEIPQGGKKDHMLISRLPVGLEMQKGINCDLLVQGSLRS